MLHHLQPEPGQADLAARRAQHAQLAQAQVGQDLAAGAVAPPLPHVLAVGDQVRLLAQPRQQRLAVARRRQHHHDPAVGRGDRAQRVAGGHAEILAAPVQQVGQRIFHLHPHQGRRVRVQGAADKREMQVVGDTVAIGDQGETAELGLDGALVDALDGVLGGQAVGDQVGDRAHLQPVQAREFLQLRAPRHAAVGIEHFHQHPGRLQPGQQRQVASRLGVAGAGQHAARLGDQREDVAGLAQVVRLGVRLDRGAHGMRAVVGGDAGGDAFGGLDADGEVGVELRGVVLDHRRQPELRAALAGQRQAHQAACMGDHEIDVRGLDQLGGHDQVALVLAVLVVDDDHHAPGADFLQQLGDGGEIQARSGGWRHGGTRRRRKAPRAAADSGDGTADDGRDGLSPGGRAAGVRRSARPGRSPGSPPRRARCARTRCAPPCAGSAPPRSRHRPLR